MPDDNYLQEIKDWCNHKGILLIFDEIQTGIGRIGALFGYQYFGVEPDIMTLAKGLGSGVPIGALLAKEQASVFSPGDHGSTFGGNPLVCATCRAVLQFIIDNDIPANAKQLGLYFKSALVEMKQKFDCIADVRGEGLLLAVDFTSDIAAEILTSCLKKGLLINQIKPNTLRFIPPLIVTKSDIDEALHILEESLNSR